MKNKFIIFSGSKKALIILHCYIQKLPLMPEKILRFKTRKNTSMKNDKKDRSKDRRS